MHLLRYLVPVLCLAIAPLSSAQDPPAPEPVPAPAPAPPQPEPEPRADIIPLVIEARGLKHTIPPTFFSARANSTIQIEAKGWTSEAQIEINILQGEAELLVLGLTGEGTVTEVTGEGIIAWSVGRGTLEGATQRFLEIRRAKDGPKTLTAVLKAQSEAIKLPVGIQPLLVGAGKAVGFSSLVKVTADITVDALITAAEGMVPMDSGDDKRQWLFQNPGGGSLGLSLRTGGAAPAAVELSNVSLVGSLDDAGRSAGFVLSAVAEVTGADGGSVAVLAGHAAVSDLPAGGEYSLRLDPAAAGGPAYRLHFDKPGSYPVRLEFQAGVIESPGRRMLDFRAPAGAVVPLRLDGLDAEADFDPACAVFPIRRDDAWTGFLPADGRCQIAWGATLAGTEEGKLFFASDATVEIRVGAGLLRQTSTLEFTLLQGKMNGVELELQGDGEILAVEGANVLSWTIEDAAEGDGLRRLVIRSAQPVAGSDRITVRSQTALGEFPLSADPLRLTPVGAVRHSGFLRVASEGAVRLEVAELTGLTQLAPEQFPGGVLEGMRQVSVFRFPSAQRSYQVKADQILPEVALSQILIYEMTDTDRIIGGRVELDIREAPLREWEILIPEDYAVVPPHGAEVADHVVGSEVNEGMRALKILFKQAVFGRQLIEFRLEKNMAAAAGQWQLPVLAHPEAKTVRGHIGVATVAGYRASAGESAELSEVPMAYFPAKADGMQLAYRLRDAKWSLQVDLAALKQSVQADVLHLYSLKEGIAYGSVLVNYFVVGAPVGEWRLRVPQEVGNLAIEGQNVQGWRREEDEIVVTLHQPTLGGAALLLTFERAMNARGGRLQPGEIEPLGVQAERGHIQVVSPSQVRHDVATASAGLLRLEPLELPAEIRVLSNAPTLAAYQYSARPVELALDIEWYEAGQTVEQVVDFAKFNSHVSNDGQVVTDARFYVRTRGRKALRLRLPTRAQLWEARVAGQAVNARRDAEFTLVPLPPSLFPNRPVEVHLQLGQSTDNPRKVSIVAPQLAAPAMIATWEITGDGDRRLLPTGKTTLLLSEPVRTESGFEWLASHASSMVIILLLLALIGAVLARGADAGSAAHLIGIFLLVATIVVAIMGAVRAGSERRVNVAKLEFIAPVVAGGEDVSVELKNLPAWEANLSNGGLLVALCGLALCGAALFGKRPRRRLYGVLGCALIAGGVLAQRGGAVVFFILLAAFLLLFVLQPALFAAIRALRQKQLESRAAAERARAEAEATEPGDDGESGPAPGSAVTSLLLAGAATLLMAMGSTPEAHAADALPTLAADVLDQKLRIADGRLYAQVDLKLSGKESDTLLLLRAPAVLTSFEGEGLRVTKRQRGEAVDYWLVLENAGRLSATASYEIPLPDPKTGFELPTSRAAVQRVEVLHGEAGWEFRSPAAVKSSPLAGLEAGQSGATLILGPQGVARIELVPIRRDLESEQALFHAEVANLFIPAPGLIDGLHKVVVRPARGQIRSLEFGVPAGFTVSDVGSAGIRNWRFDPESMTLALEFAAPISKVTELQVQTQQGTAPLPTTATIAPLQVRGAASQLGTLGIAFGNDAQPESVTADGVSKVSLDDFDASLLAGREGVALHRAFRYGAEPGTVEVTIGEVAPEVRVATRQTLSIGDERMVLAVDMQASITRAGLFQLSFVVPGTFEIEGVSGDALSHWTESSANDERVVTLHLNGRTIGQHNFAISLAGTPPDASDSWEVPRFGVREATRQTGQLLVVTEQGIRARPVARTHVSQIDARKISGGQPGTLAFRLLQADWQLALGLERLQTWVTARALQEVTLREGLTRSRIGIHYNVENAAVKSLQIRLPNLTENEQLTVRASGEGVADIARVVADEGGDAADAGDLWEIKFSRRVLGAVRVDIEFQRSADRTTDSADSIGIATLLDVRQPAYWVAVRGSGHLEVRVSDAPAGWQPVDWPSVPANLQDARDRSMPAFAFRAVDPEGPLTVEVERHAVAAALRLQVQSGDLLTAFSPRGGAVTNARLVVRVVEKSAMEVRLPAGASLMSATVNDESANIVSLDGAHRFYVLPRDDRGVADVALTWSVADGGGSRRVALNAPAFNVPLRNINWEIVLPVGYRLVDADGTLEPVGERGFRSYDFEHYRRSVGNQLNMLASEGQESLQRGIQMRDKGQQAKALVELGRAMRNSALAPSANEDARVQLRELQREQALLGVNTLSQKLYLDNAGEASVMQNVQLEQAAESNPLLRGQTDYDPTQVGNLLLGNTADEKAAKGRIADLLVSQQLAAEPALKGISVTAEGRGDVHHFRRSVQVDGDDALSLDLRIAGRDRPSLLFGALVLLGLVLLAAVALPRRREAS